jgi:hypothetical protein
MAPVIGSGLTKDRDEGCRPDENSSTQKGNTGMTTDLVKLAEAEAANVQATRKHLGFSADLLGDIELVYKAITPLVKSPGGDIDTSDELLAFLAILHELRMCEMLLTKLVVAAMRMYRGDSFTHLRRAIESCAFAVRMSKHRDLSRVWAEGIMDDDAKYKAYRKAFRSDEVFPNENHPDHDPILTDLKDKFDLCSKLIHGSPLGMAGHFATIPREQNTTGKWQINFFDMPQDSFVSSFFHILGTHCLVLRLFGRIVEPYAVDKDVWNEKYEKEYQYVAGKVQRHIQKWLPNIAVLYAARNSGQTLPGLGPAGTGR